MKRVITFSVDSSKLFEFLAEHPVGGTWVGTELVSVLLAEPDFRTRVRLELAGVSVETPSDPTLTQLDEQIKKLQELRGERSRIERLPQYAVQAFNMALHIIMLETLGEDVSGEVGGGWIWDQYARGVREVEKAW